MSNYCVLIVEDDPDDAELIKLELHKLDLSFDCSVVASEPELHAFLDKTRPDIVISDYNLPGFTGLDALQIVREKDPDLPFLLCSGFIGEEQAVDAVREGVTDYSLKNNLSRLGMSVQRELKNYEHKKERRLDHQLVQSMFNASGLSVAIMDENGIFTKVNEQFADLSGYSREELIGMSYLKLNEASKWEEAQNVFNKILADGEAHTNEWKLIRKDGSVCYARSTITRIENGELGNYIISYVQDISERKQLRAIRKHTEMMANVGGWEIDLILDRIYCNGVVLDIFELPDGLELSVNTIVDKLEPQSKKIFDEAIESTVSKGLAFDKILRSVKKNGDKIWIHASGVPQQVDGRTVRIHGTFRDVTDEKKKNEELRKLSQVASKIHNGVIIFDNEGKVDWVNDALIKATGYTYSEFLGTGFGDLLAGKDTDPEAVREVKAKFKQRIPFKQKFLVYTRDHEKKWFRIDISPIYDEVSDTHKFIGIQEDITHRKQLEEEREKALASLKERVKEQKCLYNISALDESSVDTLLKKAVKLMPPAWKYPDATAAAVSYDEQIFRSSGYRDTDWKLTAERTCLNGNKLTLSVVYLDEISTTDKTPFLKEEQQLIHSIADHLSWKIDKQLARQELQEKEQRLEKMGRISRIGYWEIDLNKHVVYWSDMTKQIFEVADDFIPDLKTAYTFYKAGEDRETIMRVVNDAIKKGKPYDVELQIVTANGNELWTRSIGESQLNEDGECIRLNGSFQDIDGQKRTQIESERNRILLEKITDQAQAAIWVRDREGRYVFCNQEWKNIFELNDQQVLGKTSFELIDEATAIEFHKNDEKVFKSNQPLKYEEQITTPQGDRYYLSSLFPLGDIPGIGEVVGGVATDITERKLMEDDLRFNTRMLNKIGEAVISTDPDGTIIYWNRAAEQLYGWSKSEAMGRNILDVTPSTTTKDMASEIFSELNEGKSWSGEFRVTRKDGTEFPANVTNSPVLDEEGNLIAVIGISSDISRHKANEHRIKESLKEKELLLAEVHHRVKNNLAIISSLLSLQLDDIDDEQFRGILINSSNRIHSIAMVHELLYQAESFTDIPFKAYINNLVVAIKQTISLDRNNIDLVTNVSVGNVNINQAIPLGLMLNELITNSLKYAFKNRKKGKIQVTISRTNGHIKVLYEDDGKGYPEDIDFTDTSSLGLTLIHTLLKQLHGEYRVETKGKFRLEFQFEEHETGSHSNL